MRTGAAGSTWWPALRLRTILLTVLLFAAAMPAIGAVFLRTYENTLVRQTEAELTSQGAALASAAANLWPGAVRDLTPADPDARDDPGYYRPERPASTCAARRCCPSGRPRRRARPPIPRPRRRPRCWSRSSTRPAAAPWPRS
jgi:hypothetical protein